MYPDLSSVKKILVVRMRHLGDVLLTTPVFTHLKKALPHAQIDAFINQESLPMLDGHPDISNYFLYDRKTLKSLGPIKKNFRELSLLRQVRKQNYDLVLNLTEGDRGALIALFSRAPIRIGFDPGRSGFFAKRKIFTHLVKICPNPRHTVERQLDVLRCLGIFPPYEERDLFLHIPTPTHESMQSTYGNDFILIHPVSRWMFKSPPASFFINLIQQLQERGEKVILSGGTDPEGLHMIDTIQKSVQVTSVAGKTTLKELGALIQLSKLLITVDSVPLHMASALKAPTIALFGPSSDINWGPWKNPHAHTLSARVSCRPCYMDGCGGSRISDCLSMISPSDVLKIIYPEESLLQIR